MGRRLASPNQKESETAARAECKTHELVSKVYTVVYTGFVV
eukprot:SAG31_NODE_1695_length_7508_cov_2.975030_8_plen_41_part_00